MEYDIRVLMCMCRFLKCFNWLNREESYSLTATAGKDLLPCSVVQHWAFHCCGDQSVTRARPGSSTMLSIFSDLLLDISTSSSSRTDTSLPNHFLGISCFRPTAQAQLHLEDHAHHHIVIEHRPCAPTDVCHSARSSVLSVWTVNRTVLTQLLFIYLNCLSHSVHHPPQNTFLTSLWSQF